MANLANVDPCSILCQVTLDLTSLDQVCQEKTSSRLMFWAYQTGPIAVLHIGPLSLGTARL